MKPILLVAILFLSGVVWYRRAQERTRQGAIDDANWDWERVRRHLDKLLMEAMGRSVVLITGYRVTDQASGQLLRQRLIDRWPDRVEVVWDKGRTDPCWVVVTASEATRVTPVLGRQWLARMRTVCDGEGCAIAHYEVHWGGSPPTLESVPAVDR